MADNVCICSLPLWLYMVLNTLWKYDPCQLNKYVHMKNLWFKHNPADSISFAAMAEEPQDLEKEANGSSLVNISQLQQVEFSTTGKSWIIPNTLMKDSEHGHQWLQIQAENYGFCNLLSQTKVDRLPTLKGSKGLVALLELRSLQMNSSSRATSNEQL